MRKARPGSAVTLLAGLLLFSGSVPAAEDQPSQTRARQDPEQAACAVADNAVPSGLVVVLESKPGDPLKLEAMKNPCLSGVALQIHWSEVEPAEGKPDWTKLDQLFAEAETDHLWVQLLIFPGFFSPEWALKDVKTDTFVIQYGPGEGSPKPFPMPWDKRYLKRWSAFLKLVSERYGKNPAFRVMAAAGPTSVSVEMMLPHKDNELQQWEADGYTPTKYKRAWQEVLEECDRDFPGQWISLSDGSTLNINERGKKGRGDGRRTREEIVESALSLLGKRFVFQNSDLSGGTVRPNSSNFLKSYIGRAVTGLQMRTSAKRESAAMGAAGDPALALRKSIDRGMEPNRAGRHVDYLEIYWPDVVADETQPALAYGASRFGAQGQRPRRARKRPSGD